MSYLVYRKRHGMNMEPFDHCNLGTGTNTGRKYPFDSPCLTNKHWKDQYLLQCTHSDSQIQVLVTHRHHSFTTFEQTGSSPGAPLHPWRQKFTRQTTTFQSAANGGRKFSHDVITHTMLTLPPSPFVPTPHPRSTTYSINLDQPHNKESSHSHSNPRLDSPNLLGSYSLVSLKLSGFTCTIFVISPLSIFAFKIGHSSLWKNRAGSGPVSHGTITRTSPLALVAYMREMRLENSFRFASSRGVPSRPLSKSTYLSG